MSRFDDLQGSINDRQQELHNVTAILAAVAARRTHWAAISRVILIALGAFAATKSTADELLGTTSHISTVLYTIVGLIIATVAGLEAAFKNEATAAELRILAAAGQSTVRQVDSRWQQDIGGAEGTQREEAALRLIDLQDTKLTELQERTAKLGVNIALEVRELVQSDRIYNAQNIRRLSAFWSKPYASRHALREMLVYSPFTHCWLSS